MIRIILIILLYLEICNNKIKIKIKIEIILLYKSWTLWLKLFCQTRYFLNI